MTTAELGGRSKPAYRDRDVKTASGFLGIGLHLILSVVNLYLVITWPLGFLLIITGPIWLLLWNCYVIINPNEAVVTQFFGKYVSTLKSEDSDFSSTHFTARPGFHCGLTTSNRAN